MCCTFNPKHRPVFRPVKAIAGPGGIQINGIHAQHMAAVEGSVSSAEALSPLDGGRYHATDAHPEIITALFRVCFKTGGMPDWGRFFRQARRLDTGILTDIQSTRSAMEPSPQATAE